MDRMTSAESITDVAGVAWMWAVAFLPRFGGALLILVLGILAARWVGAAVAKVTTRSSHFDPTLRPVISAILRYAILILVFIAALGQIGVQTTSVLAALGAAGLAIGLALQGTLANIAAGFMLLWLRPFLVGDYIDADGIAGTAREIGLFATCLDTGEGIFRFVPNALIWNKQILNYSRNPTRMMDLKIRVAFDADIDKARRIMLELANGDERVVQTPAAPHVFVDSFAENAVVLTFRAWIRNENFWPTQRYLIEETKRRFDAAGIEIPFGQRVLHITASAGPGDGPPLEGPGGGASRRAA